MCGERLNVEMAWLPEKAFAELYESEDYNRSNLYVNERLTRESGVS